MTSRSLLFLSSSFFIPQQQMGCYLQSLPSKCSLPLWPCFLPFTSKAFDGNYSLEGVKRREGSGEGEKKKTHLEATAQSVLRYCLHAHLIHTTALRSPYFYIHLYPKKKTKTKQNTEARKRNNLCKSLTGSKGGEFEPITLPAMLFISVLKDSLIQSIFKAPIVTCKCDQSN